jgi:hypothetical protein
MPPKKLSDHVASMHSRAIYGSVHILTGEHNERYAEELLVRAAKQAEPIAERRGLRVGRLVEFYPTSAELYGLNVNRGAEIRLRLRLPGDRQAFVEYDSVLSCLLHELVHNTISEHSAEFYTLLDELKAEADSLVRQGITQGRGHGERLGGPRVVVPGSAGDPAAAVRKAWQTRARILGAQGSVQRLGGDSSTGATLTPAQAAARAAERRLLDDRRCHHSNTSTNHDDDDDDVEIVSVVKKKTEPVAVPKERRSPPPVASPKRKRASQASQEPVAVPKAESPKERRASQASQEHVREQWTCATCTLINDESNERCEACNARPPAPMAVQIAWVCGACAFLNTASSATCRVCHESKR